MDTVWECEHCRLPVRHQEKPKRCPFCRHKDFRLREDKFTKELSALRDEIHRLREALGKIADGTAANEDAMMWLAKSTLESTGEERQINGNH